MVENNEDIVIEQDDYELTQRDSELREKNSKRDQQLKRWFLTVNNPFWCPDVHEEIDISNTDLFVNHDYYDLSYLKSFNTVDYFEFHFIKVKAKVEETQTEKIVRLDQETGEYIETDIKKKVKVDKEFVVERPYFKNYESLKSYIENLSVEGLKYSVGQIEKGKETGTIHLQCGIIFDEKHGKRFYTMKKYFPTARLDKIRGSNYDVKVYCTKEETRVMPPFEIGKFVEMRARTDYEEFKAALKSGASINNLMEDFFGIIAQLGLNKVELLRNEYMKQEFGKKARNVEVTYIYGKGGVGKTKSIYKEYGYDNVFSLLNFGQFRFHGYRYEKVILLDEYKGQINLQVLNKILDVHPYKCEVKGGEVIACYDKVYIVSNVPYSDMYKDIRLDEPDIYKTFDRRIHHIYEVDDNGKFICKRETVFEEVPEEEIETPGWTKRKSKIIEYDMFGMPHVIYNRHKAEQEEMTCLGEIPEADLLFDED